MREVIKIRNLKERDCTTVAERCRVLPPLPSFRVLLGYAVITWSCDNTQRCVLRMSDFSVYRRDRRQCSSSSKVAVVKWSTSKV
jgi:hypothetical protein